MKRLVPLAVVGIMGLLLLFPAGENRGSDYSGYWDEERQEYVREKEDRLLGTTTGRILGQFTFQTLLVSLFFAYRRPLGDRIGHRLRTRFHRGLGLVILVLALLHATVLLPNLVFRGWLTGLVSFTVLVVHGTLGLAKPWFLRRWGHVRWQYIHLATAWTGLLIGLQHALVYGRHYGVLSGALLGGGP